MTTAFAYEETPETWQHFHSDRPDYDTGPEPMDPRIARAIVRARKQGLKAEKINDFTRAVRSRSKATCNKHLIFLNGDGKINHCQDCPGWQFGNICDHAGAVAWSLLVERNGRKAAEKILQTAIEYEAIERLRVLRSEMPAESAPTVKGQVYRDESL